MYQFCTQIRYTLISILYIKLTFVCTVHSQSVRISFPNGFCLRVFILILQLVAFLISNSKMCLFSGSVILPKIIDESDLALDYITNKIW